MIIFVGENLWKTKQNHEHVYFRNIIWILFVFFMIDSFFFFFLIFSLLLTTKAVVSKGNLCALSHRNTASANLHHWTNLHLTPVYVVGFHGSSYAELSYASVAPRHVMYNHFFTHFLTLLSLEYKQWLTDLSVGAPKLFPIVDEQPPLHRNSSTAVPYCHKHQLWISRHPSSVPG